MDNDEQIKLARIEMARRELAKRQQSAATTEAPDFPASQVATEATKTALMAPFDVTKSMLQNPEAIAAQAPAAGAVIGGAAGAGVGQIAKRMAGIAYGTEKAPPIQPGPFFGMNNLWQGKEAIVPAAQAAVAGIPDVSGVLTAGKKTLSQAAMGAFTKAGQTVSGAKQDILQQAADQGFSTYSAPSMSTAKEIFAEALGPEGRAASKTTAQQAFDPALGQARDLATEVGTKIEKGESISALDALKARQATDRVISATPRWDTKTRAALFDWRTKFDDVMTGQSDKLANASTQYRKAIVKDQILNPTRINKHGEPSALLPMLAGVAGPLAGYESGHTGKGVLGAAGYLAVTSPMAWGAGAVLGGAISPQVRQAALASFIDKITTRDNQ